MKSSMLVYLNKSKTVTGLYEWVHAMFRNNNYRSAEYYMDKWNFEDHKEIEYTVFLYGDKTGGTSNEVKVKVKVKDYKSARNLISLWLNVI